MTDRARTAQDTAPRWQRFVRNYAPVALMALAVLAARSSLADHYIVPSGSMEPTLMPGDRVAVDKTAYGMRLPFTSLALSQRTPPKPGEVVIFDSPEDGTRLIKRVVAVAGQRVALRDGRLHLDGRALADGEAGSVEHFGDRSAQLSLQHGGGPDLVETIVPPGHLLVLGDSRGNSRDSRYFGFVREDALYARAAGVFYRSGEGFVWRPL